jgi:hypothetical protein
LQYVREVPLWAPPADRTALDKLRSVARAEQAATDALGQFLQKRKIGLPALGPYPMGFVEFNDAALHHVLPLVRREQAAALAALEADLAAVADADARAHLETMVRLKRQHQAELASLSAKPHSFTSTPA